LIWTEKKPDPPFLGVSRSPFARGVRQHVNFDPISLLVPWQRRKGLELIKITRSKKLMASDPPETLPTGHYMQFESGDDPSEYLLFSRDGKVFKVKKKDLKDAIEQGYVKA
jgi:hypothetical protein